MTTPESPPPGGDQPGRGLSGVQRAGIVLGALAVLLIVFVVLQGGDDSGSDSSTQAQTTATQTATSESTSTGATSTEDTGTTEAGDDNGSGGSGSDDSGSETGTTEDQPSPTVQTVNVVNGQPQGGVKRLEASKGDTVRFKVQSDVADEIHVHGYDLMKDVEKGGSVSFSFTANIEGRFEIELEDAGTQIAELEVKPS
jgi:cytoskeletal protein RodZ